MIYPFEDKIDTILYFYSNKEDCNDCEQQGYVLSYIKKKYPSVRVYSFDINIENQAIDIIKENYDINIAPSVVINGN